MSYQSLPTINVGDGGRASWANLVDANLDDHEARVLTEEAATTDHESRIDALETAPPAASALDDLTDVVITTPSADQVLKHDGTNWINDTAPASLSWEGAWGSGTQYAVDDVVHHDGSAWVAVAVPTIGDEPGVDADWELLAQKGTDGGVIGDWQGAWGSGTAYAQFDAVEHNGSSWIANTATSAGQEPGIHASWDLVAAKGDIGSTPTVTRFVGLTIDGGGSVITTGVKGYVSVPFAGTITNARLLADQAGDIVIDVWKDSFANYPPTDADSITAAAPPTLSAANKSDDSTLTGWTTSISAGDVLGFNVDSVSTVERVHLMLTVTT